MWVTYLPKVRAPPDLNEISENQQSILNVIYTVFVNNGFTVYHDIAGKKIIGTASPGNNSGYLISSGNVNEIGIITHANDIIEKRKLNINSPFFFNHIIIPQ